MLAPWTHEVNFWSGISSLPKYGFECYNRTVAREANFRRKGAGAGSLDPVGGLAGIIAVDDIGV